MSVYNKDGNLTDVRAADTAVILQKITERLYETLFADGMTALEGRALLDSLTSSVGMAATIAISMHQMNQLTGEGEGQIDPSNGDD